MSDSSILLTDGMVVVSGDGFKAVRPETGEIIWKAHGRRIGGDANTPVAATLEGRPCIVHFSRYYDTASKKRVSGIIGIDRKTGEVLWFFPSASVGNCISFCTYGDYILAHHQESPNLPYTKPCFSYCIRIKDNKPVLVWKSLSIQQYWMTGCVDSKGRYYIQQEHTDWKQLPKTWKGKAEPGLHCFDVLTGKRLWKTRMSGMMSIADDKVFVQNQKSLTLFKSHDDGPEVLASANVGEKPYARWGVLTHPALVDGRLYIKPNKGDLCCLDLRPREGGEP
jgi:outer membrane protein assembly factor BamB